MMVFGPSNSDSPCHIRTGTIYRHHSHVLCLLICSRPLTLSLQTFTESTNNYNWKTVLEDVVRHDDFYLSEGELQPHYREKG